MKKSRRILFAAGGTGGHFFPAKALGDEMEKRGWEVHFATDKRISSLVRDLSPDSVHIFESATFELKKPLHLIKNFIKIFRGIIKAYRFLRVLKPTLVVGFGGYPSFPPLCAAFLHRIPCVIHEQNAIMGRANTILSPFVSAIAFGFPFAKRNFFSKKSFVTGNPVRSSILSAAAIPYEAPTSKIFRLLIFGGSQGAHFFSQCLPDTIAKLSDSEKRRIEIVQQVRLGEEESVSHAYSLLGVQSTISSFFFDIPERIARSHLVICRAGASTISEIAVIGRPALLIPYPYALDHDQEENAKSLVACGGAKIYRQSSLTPEILAAMISEFLSFPDRLSCMADGAHAAGKPLATKVLADLLESVALRKMKHLKIEYADENFS